MISARIYFVLKTIQVDYAPFLSSIEFQKNEIIQTAVKLAKYGTICGCPNVNRMKNCNEDEMESYISKSILENKDLVLKGLKYVLEDVI